MNTRLSFQLFLGLGVLGAVCAGDAFAASTNTAGATTNSTAKKTALRTNTPPPIEVAVSKFTIPTSIAEGRDPFFPNSTRLSTTVVSTSPNGKRPAPVSLVLQGISGKFALINGRTLEVNEEADVTTAGGKIRVRCLNINEDVVVIEADGARQELRLRPGL